MPSSRVPLVLLPGLLNDARLWQHQIAGLDDMAQARVGELTRGTSMAELATEVLAQVQEQRFVLAGFSMGGYAALEIIRQAPRRVSALALIDTSARPDTPEATQRRREQVARSRTDFRAVVEETFPEVVHPSRANDTVLREIFVDMALRVGAAAFARQQEAIIGRPDSRPALATIACPTLVACGAEDPVIPRPAHEELAVGIAGAQLVVLGECGHLSPLERAPELTEALRTFLVRVTQ
jgi:pimeloyl-ACP methyl ester carboxylesterase